MKNNKVISWVIDALKGMAMGLAVVIPGVAAGTIAVIVGCYEKIINALKDIVSRRFFRNVLVLLPFLVGAVVSIAAAWVPLSIATEKVLLGLICLFVGLIIGSIPGITKNIKGTKPTAKNILITITAFIIAVLIGVLSIVINMEEKISQMFGDYEQYPIYLFIIIFFVGLVGSAGFIVPGISGAMILVLLGFYKPILKLVYDHNPDGSVEFFLAFKKNPGGTIGLLLCFILGILVGVLLLSRLMGYLLAKHKTAFYFAVLGFVLGSIVSLFLNSTMMEYYKNNINVLDAILGPIFLILGIFLSYLLVKFSNKKENA